MNDDLLQPVVGTSAREDEGQDVDEAARPLALRRCPKCSTRLNRHGGSPMARWWCSFCYGYRTPESEEEPTSGSANREMNNQSVE